MELRGCGTERLHRGGTTAALRTFHSELREAGVLTTLSSLHPITPFPTASLLFLKRGSPMGHLYMLILWIVLPPVPTWLVPRSV